MVGRPSLANPHDAALPPSPFSEKLQRLGLAVFFLGILATVVFLATEHWRRGTFAFGVAMVWLAVLRQVADSHIMGALAVRSRRFDSLFTGALGALMIYLSASVDALGS